MNKKTFLSFLILFAAGFTRLFAAYNSLGIPDSSEIRKTLIESWFEAPLQTVRTNNAFETRNQIGEEFQVRLEEDDQYFYIFVAPHSILTVKVKNPTQSSRIIILVTLREVLFLSVIRKAANHFVPAIIF